MNVNKRALIEYTTENITINPNGQYVQADCADIAFLNYGTATLIVNSSMKIPPPATAGQFNMITISSNVGEINRTKYFCKFSAIGTKQAIIVRRNYK